MACNDSCSTVIAGFHVIPAFLVILTFLVIPAEAGIWVPAFARKTTVAHVILTFLVIPAEAGI
jgi:hypothetical protein